MNRIRRKQRQILLDTCTHIEKANLQIMFGEQGSTEKEAKRIFKRIRISTPTYKTDTKRQHKYQEKT
jgi:hypothetical protein